MFTGIVEEVGTVESVKKGAKSIQITVQAKTVLENTKIGDSICTSGVCLTVVEMTNSTYTADVMAESIRRTSLDGIKPGDKLNLERAMAADGRFGGHIVAGHVDGTGVITGMQQEDNAVWITVSASPQVLRYIVEKGSITMDGVSLTVAYVDDRVFKVSVIPHTCANTTLLLKKPGSKINLECDIIGKYVEKLMTPAPQEDTAPASGVTADFLSKHGFL